MCCVLRKERIFHLRRRSDHLEQVENRAIFEAVLSIHQTKQTVDRPCRQVHLPLDRTCGRDSTRLNPTPPSPLLFIRLLMKYCQGEDHIEGACNVLRFYYRRALVVRYDVPALGEISGLISAPNISASLNLRRRATSSSPVEHPNDKSGLHRERELPRMNSSG